MRVRSRKIGEPSRPCIRVPLLILSLFLAGCVGDEGADGASSKPERKTPEHLVTALTAVFEFVSADHDRPGSLSYRKLVRIHNQEEGRITALDLFEGDHVGEGQLMVRLEDDLLRAELDKARATKEQEKLDLARLEGLRERRAVSEDELAQARTSLAVAEAEERLLETQIGRASCRERV